MEKVVIVSRGPILLDRSYGNDPFTIRYSHCKQESTQNKVSVESLGFQVPVCSCPEFGLQDPLVGCRHIKELMGQSLTIARWSHHPQPFNNVTDETIAVPLVVHESVQTFVRYLVPTIAWQADPNYRRLMLPTNLLVSVDERANVYQQNSLLGQEELQNPLYGMPLYAGEWTTFADLQDHTFSILEVVRQVALDEQQECLAEWHKPESAIQKAYRDFEEEPDSIEYLLLLADMWAIVRRGMCLKCAHTIPAPAKESTYDSRRKVFL